MQQTNLDIFNDAIVSEKENIETNIFDNAVVTDGITDTSPIIPPKKNTYEGIKSDANMRARAVRFAKNHLGHENIDEDEAVDEFIEHFRQFNVNVFIFWIQKKGRYIFVPALNLNFLSKTT